MGIQQKQGELWAKAVDLGSRVPEGHLLRQIDRLLDLSFIREKVAHLFGKNGNVSVDPVVIMRMMILLFVDNLRSERELMRQIPLRIDYLWFLGYGLDDEVPDHSVLSKARKRWGKTIFDELFGRVVLQCIEAELVGSEKVHIDSSLIRADASLASVVKTLVGEEMEKLEELADKEEAPRPKHKPINTRYRSTTDPDSRVVRHDGGKSKPCFKNHRVIDDRAGVTTAVATTHGVENDGSKLMDMLDQHEDRKRRQWFQERNFGEAAVMHGVKRARWRGLEKQSIQDLLIATIQNLKILGRRSLWAFFCLTKLSCRAWKGHWKINIAIEGFQSPSNH